MVEKITDTREFGIEVVNTQIRISEDKSSKKIVCYDFSTICYKGGPCSICGGRGWIRDWNK